MLQTLSIRDFVIVDVLDLEFSRGFTVLTGETGAGKSILIDALSLALGARGEGGIARAGCDKAEISASFDIGALPALQSWLAENELPNEEHQLLVRRVVYADGRSRAFINGLAATIQQLRDAGEFLVDIYSQHAHHSLLKPAYQRQILDNYAGQLALAGEVGKAYGAWYALKQQRDAIEKNTAAYADELAELRDDVRELAQLSSSIEEWESLQTEHARLSHGAALLTSGAECQALLSEGDFAALGQLSQLQSKLQHMVEYDDSLIEAVDTLDSAIIQLEETDRFLNRYLQRTELDPDRLNEVELRIQSIHAMSRKHRVRPEELPEILLRWKTRMNELESFANNDALEKQESAANLAFTQMAEKLSAIRQQAAKTLSEKITMEMQRLALSGGRFEVILTPQQASAAGLESIEFLVAGHAGVSSKPLAKVASGGELSRISLAIRVTTASQGEIPTMIFDEVDVGIGGGVAEIVGKLLKQLGVNRQALVITHLPQVAAQGTHHLKVSKIQQNGSTLSHISTLDKTSRIEEISRMLGGLEITETTRRHASEMLGF